MTLTVKRVTAPPDEADGARILVDSLWPRGHSKDKLHLTAWLRDVAPSTELRKWFGHDPAKWDMFRKRYRAEMDANPAAVSELRNLLGKHADATLLFAAHDAEHNNAVALAEYLRERGRRHAAS
jgi:uncharacterized protein YeaO (DUF488 family)